MLPTMIKAVDFQYASAGRKDIQALASQAWAGVRIERTGGDGIGLLQMADLEMGSEHQAEPGAGHGKENPEE